MKKIFLLGSVVGILMAQGAFASTACDGISAQSGKRYDLQVNRSGEDLNILISQNSELLFEGLAYQFQTSLYVGQDGKKHEATTYWNRKKGEVTAIDLKVKMIDQNILQLQLVSPEAVNLKCIKVVE